MGLRQGKQYYTKGASLTQLTLDWDGHRKVVVDVYDGRGIFIHHCNTLSPSPKPLLRMMVQRYVREIRSKASLRSRDTTHNGQRVVSA